MARESNLIKALGDMEFAKFLFFDVLFALIVGVFAWFISQDSVTSLLLSLLVAIILLMVELRFQLTIGQETLTRALGFEQKALKDGFLLVKVPDLVESYSSIVASRDELFVQRAQHAISEATADVRNIKEGYFKVRPEDFNAVVNMMLAGTKKAMFGTVFVKMADYWFGGSGKAYFVENLEAVRRGVKITRVFFLEEPAHLGDEIKRLIRAQADGGIDVRIAMTRNLTPDLLRDIGIFDENYVWYHDLVPGATGGVQGSGVYRDDREVRRALVIRDRILREARPAIELLQELESPAAAPSVRSR